MYVQSQPALRISWCRPSEMHMQLIFWRVRVVLQCCLQFANTFSASYGYCVLRICIYISKTEETPAWAMEGSQKTSSSDNLPLSLFVPKRCHGIFTANDLGLYGHSTFEIRYANTTVRAYLERQTRCTACYFVSQYSTRAIEPTQKTPSAFYPEVG